MRLVTQGLATGEDAHVQIEPDDCERAGQVQDWEVGCGSAFEPTPG